ncbi:MAG TPA: polysaccharide biosynthesis protein [Clostridia bacterium]|nr:polysaccharide biosynthesis protein [Clostridia bacterium]
MKSRLLSGAVVLAVSSVVAKVLGALYRVPLTNILGAEGMGLYQLVFPIYALFLTMSTSGLPTALSRIVAEKKTRGESCKKFLVATAIMLISFCIISAILVALLSPYTSKLQGNSDTQLGFWIIAPAIIFVGGIAVLRGWFQGNFNMLPTALSNIIEQVVKLAVGLTLSIVFAKYYGVVYAVYGALIGVTLSEIVALSYLLVTYWVKERHSKKEVLKPKFGDYKILRKVATPIALMSFILPLSQFADSFMIVNILKNVGLATEISTAQYGLLSGPVASLINLPIVILLSLSIAIVPNVSAGRVARDLDGIMRKSALSIKLTYLIGVPSALFFLVFARPIVALLYPNIGDASISLTITLLSISSVSIVFLSAMQVYTALLQALDRTMLPVRNLAIAVVIKIALSFVLTYKLGIVGSAISNVVMSAVAYTLNAISFRNYLGQDIKLVKNLSAILFSGVIMALSGFAIVALSDNPIVEITVGAVVCTAVYTIITLAGNTIDDNEANSLPFGNTIIRMKKSLRFWE